ncbi:hypothetical protein GCM10023214_05850 [Amycolatopsis dongchuanensis]|uniref:Tautomerase enzyme n=3 Tax=Pseudonocardiaceae TaxID=2070 RepID=A0A1I3P4Q6_9PSEU|nr:hypothetical protein SAMN05421835_103272 [Amycolatopsis sacchari]
MCTLEVELIQALTDAIGDVYGEQFSRLAGVDLIGIPRRRRGTGGVAGNDEVLVTLNLREGAYRVPDAQARLITAITDRVVGALGEDVRDRVVVTLTATPGGYIGTGGKVA